MAKKLPGKDRLAAYRAKRSVEVTPEPFPREAVEAGGLFVVQKHAARSMHYDLRLEIGGALHSWAVPKGPSLDPEQKRLAVEVEEHPLEYGNFEGLIPEGNYGAGAVIVWDRGQWDPLGHDPEEGLVKGKLLFDLRGYKLGGRWTLFRTKRSDRDWLLMKKPDAWADAEAELPEESILSGLTVEELRDGVDPAARVRSRIERLEAPRGPVDAGKLEVMLAQPRTEPFSKPGWLFELKYDGYRLLAVRDGSRTFLRYRRGHDATASFPEITRALARLPYESFVLDGELVALDETGRPGFGRLQQRVHLSRPADIERATVHLPVTLFVFDLLAFDDRDLRPLPLIQRKKLLQPLLPRAGPLRFTEHIDERGREMFEQVREMRLEGIVAKRADAPYRSGRSSDWIKIRCDRTGDFVVVGYSPPKGGRSGFGALHLAVRDSADLVYAGRVGTGFSEHQLADLHGELEARRRAEPPCRGRLPSSAGHTWVDPELVCEVRYKEWTGAGQLRHPVFLRLRDDVRPEACQRRDAPAASEPKTLPQPAAVERKVSFTNLKKTFWPEEGYTKGDLIEFYRKIGPWILPYLQDRPLVLTRYPDGIDGKNFFQKDAPSFIPDWVRTEKMWSEHAQRDIHYFVCDNLETLLYVINMGTIPLHIWSSRVASLQQPDWCILDLDPKEAPFKHVIRVARAIRALCEEIDLACLVKTSGSTGLHILVPLGGQCSYEESRSLGELLARVVAAELPKISTLIRSPAARGGRVYIDYLQNGHGRLLVAPFSVRPLPAAPVSTPLRWSEVKAGLTIRKFTVRSVPARVRRMREEPMRTVLALRPDLTRALGLLERRMAEGST